MKLLASAMITAACAMLGVYAASGAAAGHRSLESIVIMISDIRTRLEFVCMPVDDLLDTLCGDARFQRLVFLKKCREACSANEPFPKAWEAAVISSASDCRLSGQDSEKLIQFGKSLGSTDLRGQIACCDLYLSLFKSRVEEHAAVKEKYSKMLPSLGALGGLALSILII